MSKLVGGKTEAMHSWSISPFGTSDYICSEKRPRSLQFQMEWEMSFSQTTRAAGEPLPPVFRTFIELRRSAPTQLDFSEVLIKLSNQILSPVFFVISPTQPRKKHIGMTLTEKSIEFLPIDNCPLIIFRQTFNQALQPLTWCKSSEVSAIVPRGTWR